MSAAIRVLIADDHAVLREGLVALIDGQEDLTVVAQASDGLEAIELASEHKPDVIVLDITMPRCGGIRAIDKIREVTPHSRILILTMHDDQTYLRAALAAGAAGYVVKRTAGKQLLAAIREVHEGRSYINVTLSPATLQEVVQEKGADGSGQSMPLSSRELEVLKLVARGFTNKQIAEQLDVAKKTVDTYRARVAEKLNLHTRADLVRYALETGLLGPDNE